jgi:AAA+ superfamily predicted ATPase
MTDDRTDQAGDGNTHQADETVLDPAASTGPLAGSDPAPRSGGRAALPAQFPAWASKLAELYFSGTTSMFVIHGNTFDVVRAGGDPRPQSAEGGDPDGSAGEAGGKAPRPIAPRWIGLADFLAEQLFGRWDLVIHYDLARGLRCAAGANAKRLQQMVELANRWIGDLRALPRDPTRALAALDLLVQKNVMADPEKRIRAAIIIDHAGYVAPSGDRLDRNDQTHLVTLLNWAASPYVKRINLAFALIDPRLSSIAERLTSNPHVAAIEVPLPSAEDRAAFLAAHTRGSDLAGFSDYTAAELAKLTAGIGLTDLEVLVSSSRETGRRLDRTYFRELKKRLIERQAQGMLEFVEPRWGLDTVVGHAAAKRRLLDDAELLKRGELDTVPMGYLFCGPVGTGKSFLATCVAGSIGIPAVVLKNFRSKYVGETEGNLERVLGVLRSMGPVVVIIDEADAMLGDRDQAGDSGVGARTFGMIAAQMGDTRYRGQIVWMLLTARPDLLPIDLKRQGRAEVHIPLFYPTDDAELRTMMMVMAKKSGTELGEADLPAELPHKGNLSGADIEGIVGRAYRASLLAGSRTITRTALAGALAGFMPSTQTLEREAQELAAIIECSDAEFLPPSKLDRLSTFGGREKLQERLTAIKQILEAT